MSSFLVLLRIAFRNLFANFLNFIVGAIILFGTFLVLVGGGVLDSLDSAMSRSIIGSVAGHVQLYSEKSKDELQLYGDFAGDPDIEPIMDFPKLRDALHTVSNVKTVIPMGIRGAIVTSGNSIDTTLEQLRQSVKKKLAGDSSAELADQLNSQKDHVRQIVRVLQTDLVNAQKILAKNALEPEIGQAIEQASSDGFWEKFDSAPLDALEFLENRIAPLATDADIIYIRYVGTDLDRFQESFDRMKIVNGTAVPKGQRGFLFSKFTYEEMFKLKSARRMDRIKEAMTERGKTIATDEETARWVKMNQSQTKEILLQMDRLKTETAIARLQKSLGSKETDLTKLLVQLFDMNDANFSERYKIFYSDLAPLLTLYRVKIGDMLPIKTFTRSGYMESVNVKVYGTFTFEGLENSPLSGTLNLMDLQTFRSLYGFLTPERMAEIQALKAASGSKEINRETAEADLFGGSDSLITEAKSADIDDPVFDSGAAKREDELINQKFTQEEIDQGVVLNVAVILKDGKKLHQSIEQIQAVAKPFGLKAVSWAKAAGFVGQLITVAKLVLYFAVGVIFIVALVIINNAMMMATLQRVREIGTMRAIGANRSFILNMILTETVVLGLVFGAIGGLLGAGLMAFLNTKGIPATNDAFYFFFSGPRLHPVLGPGNVIAAFVIVLLVSAISTLYPAFLATRVSPVEAMANEE